MIYEPSDDSFLLVSAVNDLVSGGRALDMGCGSGVIIRSLINKGCSVVGVDINPEVIDYCSHLFPGARFIRSDLFSGVNGFFDVITFNPPYLPADSLEDEDTALVTTGGVYGYELIIRFLEQAVSHLSSDGFILLIISSLSNKELILSKSKLFGYDYVIVGSKKLFFEELYCVKLWVNK